MYFCDGSYSRKDISRCDLTEFSSSEKHFPQKGTLITGSDNGHLNSENTYFILPVKNLLSSPLQLFHAVIGDTFDLSHL